MISLIAADRSDVHKLTAIWSQTFREAYFDVHSQENIEAYIKENFTVESAADLLSETGTVCKFALDGRTIVGYYILRGRNAPESLPSSALELKQIYILANQYGTGLGRTLHDNAIQTARERGAETVWLCVSDINHRAKTFYEKLGYRVGQSGPIFSVGSDKLASTVMILDLV